MQVSVIIPTLNEEDYVGDLVCHLRQHSNGLVKEIIVVDGGSTDGTVAAAMAAGATVYACPCRCRAMQMNLGAAHALGDLLYFVHADAYPPTAYPNHIAQALSEGYGLGCFRFVFDSQSRLLAINAYCTRFDWMWCRGGDQTLFVRRELFDRLGGFHEHYVVMEDYDLILRAKKIARFKIIPHEVVVSARKYKANSYLRVNLANLIVFVMFFLRISPKRIRDAYTAMIRHPKAF